MKALKRKSATIPNSRWLAYATAGVASAFTYANSAQAAIHYSGDLHEQFGPHKEKLKAFPLDQAGDDFQFERNSGSNSSQAAFFCHGIVSNAFRGFGPNYLTINRFYVSRLPKGENISSGHFTHVGLAGYPSYGILDSRFGIYQSWTAPGIGFVGFRFNSGAGDQYGWARVRMAGAGWANAFKLIDYAYADPGEPIRAGQRSSDEQAPDQGSTDEQGPDEGSLGWLALGAAGLLAWRRRRARMTSLE